MRNRTGFLLYSVSSGRKRGASHSVRFDSLKAARAAAMPVLSAGHQAVIVREDWRETLEELVPPGPNERSVRHRVRERVSWAGGQTDVLAKLPNSLKSRRTSPARDSQTNAATQRGMV